MNQDFEEQYEKHLQYLQMVARHCTSNIPLQAHQDYCILFPKFQNWQVENYPFECYWLIMNMIKNQNAQALTQFNLKLSNPSHTIPKDYIPLLSSYDLVNQKGDIYPQIYALFDHSAH